MEDAVSQDSTGGRDPLVSVIVPAYNVRDFIADAIASIQSQNYPNIEVLVIDDGSRDDTAEIVASRFPTVRLFRKANGGAASARNVGLREARGDFIAFLDGDDVWLQGKVRAQVDYLAAHPDIALLATGFSFWRPREDGLFGDPRDIVAPASAAAAIDAQLSGWGYHRLLLDSFVWTSTVMMRRSLVDAIGLFDESLRLGQDLDYFLRASRETQIHVLAGGYAAYRQHQGSAIARGADVNYAAHIIRRAVAKWGMTSPNGEGISPRQLRERLHQIHFASGYRHFRRGNMPAALAEFRQSIGQRPFHAKSWGYAVLSAVRKSLGSSGS